MWCKVSKGKKCHRGLRLGFECRRRPDFYSLSETKHDLEPDGVDFVSNLYHVSLMFS